jgi:hypothetical protein
MDKPDLMNDDFDFYRNAGAIYSDHNLVIIKKDWCHTDWNLSTEQVIDICNRIMIWFELPWVILVANRTRMSNLHVDAWTKYRIRLKHQATGFCDYYYVERKKYNG